jgi:hypothetical protein
LAKNQLIKKQKEKKKPRLAAINKVNIIFPNKLQIAPGEQITFIGVKANNIYLFVVIIYIINAQIKILPQFFLKFSRHGMNLRPMRQFIGKRY